MFAGNLKTREFRSTVKKEGQLLVLVAAFLKKDLIYVWDSISLIESEPVFIFRVDTGFLEHRGQCRKSNIGSYLKDRPRKELDTKEPTD